MRALSLSMVACRVSVLACLAMLPASSRATPSDLPPVLVAPSELSSSEGESISFGVMVSDPDGQPIESLVASPLPTGATFTTNPENTQGTFSWVPDFFQAGVYTVSLSAESACRASGVSSPVCVTGSASTRIIVANTDRTPTLELSGEPQGAEGQPFSLLVVASDPDGEPITSLDAAPLPSGATFAVLTGTNSLAALEWTPTYDQAGTYPITFRASNGLTVEEPVSLVVSDVDRAPTVSAPSELADSEAVKLTFSVTANDPDGELIGTLTASHLPRGAAFTASSDRMSGIFAWTPDYTQAGVYGITFSATSCTGAGSCLTGSVMTQITVLNVDRLPSIDIDPVINIDEGSYFNWDALICDPDGDRVTSFTVSPLPEGAYVQADDFYDPCLWAYFSWRPTYQQAGVYLLTFHLESGCDRYGNERCATVLKTVRIEVAGKDEPPHLNTGGAYCGVVNAPVAFDASQTWDAEGELLGFKWDFGDGTTGSGVRCPHVYTRPGSFQVKLTVNDGRNAVPLWTTATIGNVLPAGAFSAEWGVYVGAASTGWCVRVEPGCTAYEASDIRPESITLSYAGATCHAVDVKSSVIRDTNRNGIDEVGACFSADGLRDVFGALPIGDSEITARVEGETAAGRSFVGELPIYVVVDRSSGLSVRLSPNPATPETVLSFTTFSQGKVQVRVFSIQGRLVRTLLTSTDVGPGYHRLPLDSGRGSLASGIYFYLVEAEGRAERGRFVVVR